VTLIEVSVVVALSSIVMGIVISLAIALQQSDRKLRWNGVHTERLTALAETLRTDIRAASDVSVSTEKTLVVASAGVGETRYELTAMGCRRIVADVSAEAGSRRDFFAIDGAHSWIVERGTPGRRPLILVRMHYAKDEDGSERAAPLLVYAALGADLQAVVAPSSQAGGDAIEREREEFE